MLIEQLKITKIKKSFKEMQQNIILKRIGIAFNIRIVFQTRNILRTILSKTKQKNCNQNLKNDLVNVTNIMLVKHQDL